jgi:hypothetical protein
MDAAVASLLSALLVGFLTLGGVWLTLRNQEQRDAKQTSDPSETGNTIAFSTPTARSSLRRTHTRATRPSSAF